MHGLAKIILNLDRRIIYSIVMLCVAIPLIKPLGMPFRITPEVQNGFELIESLKTGDVIVISADYGPSAEAETHPMYIALLHQCFRKGIRPVVLTLIPDGLGWPAAGWRTCWPTARLMAASHTRTCSPARITCSSATRLATRRS